MIRLMSKTVPVSFGDRLLWAHDVSFGILILEAIGVAAATPRPEGAGEGLEVLRANLPTVAEAGRHWLFGVEGGPSTI